MECREWPGTLLCCGAEREREQNNGDADWQTMEKRNKSVEEREQVHTLTVAESVY